MFGQHWWRPGYWRWVWMTRASSEARLVAALLLLAAVFVGGWFGASLLTAAGAQPAADSFMVRETVTKVVTVRRSGKVVRRLVPVIRRVAVAPETRYATDVVTAPAVVRTVQLPVVSTRVRDRLVTLRGSTVTVRQTQLVPTTVTSVQLRTVAETVTRTLTNTDLRTVTNTAVQTATVVSTVVETLPVTVTATLPAVTVTTIVTTTVRRR